MLAISCNVPVIELLYPFGWDIGSLPEGDSERGEPIVSAIPVWSLDEGLLIIEKTRLGELEVFFKLVDRSLVFFVLGVDLALILLMTAV